VKRMDDKHRIERPFYIIEFGVIVIIVLIQLAKLAT